MKKNSFENNNNNNYYYNKENLNDCIRKKLKHKLK